MNLDELRQSVILQAQPEIEAEVISDGFEDLEDPTEEDFVEALGLLDNWVNLIGYLSDPKACKAPWSKKELASMKKLLTDTKVYLDAFDPDTFKEG